MKTYGDKFLSDPQNMREFQQERAMYEVTELIESIMQKDGVSRSILAKKLGRSKGWVTQLLDGESNKTVRTLADTLAVLGYEMRVQAMPFSFGTKPIKLKLAAGTWGEQPQSWSTSALQTTLKRAV